ncbi:MAG TPA: GTP-binding protein [Ktedonobacterales bacterium]
MANDSIFRRTLRNTFSLSGLAGLPKNLSTARRFLASVDWKAAQAEIATDLQRKVAIIGLANCGKSTLFNTLSGKYLSLVSATAGSTTSLVRGTVGPFVLIDTPGHMPDMQLEAVNEAALVVYMLDASAGLRAQDAQMIAQLRAAEKPLIVVLNKADLLGNQADEAAATAAARLGVPDIIPISARKGDNIADELLPAMITASPAVALVMGRQLPAFRRTAANRIVRNATLIGLAAGLEPIPLVDIPILLGNQIRMVLRIATVYGEPLTANHARELAATVAGGLAFRYLAEQVSKLVPVGGDFIAGAVAAGGTWSLGQVAIEYFESGKRLSGRQMRSRFQGYVRQFREQRLDRDLAKESTGKIPPLDEDDPGTLDASS